MKNKRFSKLIIVAVILFAVTAAASRITGLVSASLEFQRSAALKEAVIRAAKECYCVEGVYPRNLSYLEDHYGLMVNHKRYIVSYDCSASNRLPQVMILSRK